MNKKKDIYSLPPFLSNSNYRIWRHLLFVVMGVIITFNMVFIAYQDCHSTLGNRIYLICLSSFVLYLVAMYFNYYYLVPKFLLRGKYTTYLIVLLLIAIALPTFAIAEEYWVRNSLALPHRIASYTNPIILVDNLASSMSIIICFMGALSIVLLRQWISRNEHVSMMEYEHLKSEVNKLKGQITPSFVSKTLNNTSVLVKTNPQKTSGMLMCLGQLLRYQLYDCNRDKVFLKSEIDFLSNYLGLEQLNRSEFQYSINTQGQLNNLFISPMLFISLIQHMINESNSLHLSFNLEGDSLHFICKSDNTNQLADDSLYSIHKRLELLYPNSHTLATKPGIIELQIAITE